MTVNATFTDIKAGIGCPMCPDTHRDDLVVELPSGLVHLQDDASYRGYCILIFRRHVVELYELTPEERADWIEDVAAIGKAIAAVCAPGKLNVSMLGNQVPHLHCHLMPRYPDDGDWGHPPAFRPPAERRSIPAEEYVDLRSKLAAELTGRKVG
jgi:diadenosine tetraphosphate (Ap4A) HIT family hydrolase